MISSTAIQHLQQARKETQSALDTINNLIVEHEFQDIAELVTRASDSLLEAATLLMQSQDVSALAAMERADDYVARAYEIIDEELDEED